MAGNTIRWSMVDGTYGCYRLLRGSLSGLLGLKIVDGFGVDLGTRLT